MALTASNVRVAQTGRVYIAPVGTTAPTDVAAAWSASWIDLGYLTDDGVTFEFSTDVEDIMAWQSLPPIRKIKTSVELTCQFTCMEFHKTAIGLYFPGIALVNAGGTVTGTISSASPSDERALGIEWSDGSTITRVIIGRGEVTERGEIELNRENATGLELTYVAYAPTSGSTLATVITNDPSWV